MRTQGQGRRPSSEGRRQLARVDRAKLSQCAREIENDLARDGYELVDLRVGKAEGRLLVELLIDHPERGITNEDCARGHETVDHWFDALDPVSGPYMLQVSSPGLDRPLRKDEHFRRFAGSSVRMKVRGENGTRKVRGKLVGFEDGLVTVQTGETDEAFAIEDILEARLHYEWDDLLPKKDREA